MKKEKSLIFLSSKWMMSAFLALGILFCSNTMFAQNGPLAEKITSMEELRDSFAPGTAKYDIVQDAIDYLNVLDANLSTNPNFLNSGNDVNPDPFQNNLIRRTHPTILAEYSQSQLAEFQALQSEYAIGNQAPNPQAEQKLQWVLDANAY